MEIFTYTSSHVDVLKKDRVRHILFMTLGCLVLLLQSITWLIVWYRDMAISVSDMVFVGITLVATFMFIGSQLFFVNRNKKIVAVINSGEVCTTKRVKLRFSNKSSFGGALVVLARIIAILFVILLGITIVNFVQDYLNWGKIILKMPFMVLCAIEFLQLSSELRFQAMLEQK